MNEVPEDIVMAILDYLPYHFQAKANLADLFGLNKHMTARDIPENWWLFPLLWNGSPNDRTSICMTSRASKIRTLSIDIDDFDDEAAYLQFLVNLEVLIIKEYPFQSRRTGQTLHDQRAVVIPESCRKLGSIFFSFDCNLRCRVPKNIASEGADIFQLAEYPKKTSVLVEHVGVEDDVHVYCVDVASPYRYEAKMSAFESFAGLRCGIMNRTSEILPFSFERFDLLGVEKIDHNDYYTRLDMKKIALRYAEFMGLLGKKKKNKSARYVYFENKDNNYLAGFFEKN
jgi:hypothetical protein